MKIKLFLWFERALTRYKNAFSAECALVVTFSLCKTTLQNQSQIYFQTVIILYTAIIQLKFALEFT